MGIKKIVLGALKKRGLFVHRLPVLSAAELSTIERYDPYKPARPGREWGATASDGRGNRFKYLPVDKGVKRDDPIFVHGIGACAAMADTPPHHMCWHYMFGAECEKAF